MRKRIAFWTLALTVPVLAEGKTWAIVVGIDEYVRPSIPKLRYAVADAKLFAQALKDTMKVPADNIYLMTSDTVDENAQPRVINVAYRLDSLKKQVKPEDTVIFYFAGHGLTMDGKPYLLTEEADNRSAMTLKVSALFGGDVIESLRSAKTANTWVVLDACRNSPNSKEDVRLDAAVTGSFSDASVGRDGSATMFSCKVGERSWEWDEMKHGCYTYFLVDGLRRQAADEQGRITMQSLSNYVGDQVPKTTSKMGSPQNPTLFYGGGGADRWVLANVGPVAKATPKGPKGQAEAAQYVARLEILQARLDKETARRVAAEQRARGEESKRLELEQRLTAMEKQISPKVGMTGPKSQPQMLAYADRGFAEPDRSQQLEQEVKRLEEENRNLSKRIADMELACKGQTLASRDVQLASNLQAERAKEGQLAGQVFGDAAERLKNCLAIRESQGRQLKLLENAYGAALAARKLPPEVAAEVAFLQEQIEVQKNATHTYQQKLTAAQLALQESDNRLLEAEKRLEKYEAIIQDLTQKLQDAERELVQLNTKLKTSEEEKQAAIRRADAAVEQLAMLDRKQEEKHKLRWGGRNPWKITTAMKMSNIVEATEPEAKGFGP